MSTLLTKRSNTAAAVPLAAQLTNSTGGAELAVNTADKRLFTKDGAGAVVELGTAPTSLAVTNNASVGGVLSMSAGTAGAPAITRTGDTNTGIFFPAADTIAFAEGGLEAMRLDASGNLMLGTTTAASIFTVAPPSGTNSRISLTTATNSTTSTTGITALKSGYIPGTTAASNTLFTLAANALDSGSVVGTYGSLNLRQRVVSGGALRGRAELIAGDGSVSNVIGGVYLGYNPYFTTTAQDSYGVTLLTGESAQIIHGQNLEFANLSVNPVPYATFTSVGDFGLGTTTPAAKLDVNGTARVSGAVTLSGGTANGVAYLNGSKVLTTGSALTFDGTTLALNGGTVGTRLAVKGTGAFGGFDTGAALDGRVEYAYNGSNIFYTGIDSASLMTLMARSGVSLAFGANGSEQMRLTTTGLGIGTSSPGFRLDAVNNTAGLARFSFSNPNAGMTQTDLRIGAGSNTNDLFIGITSGNSTLDNRSTNGNLIFLQSGTERMRLAAGGNLGLGVTPSAWGGTKALEVSVLGSAMIAFSANNTQFLSNAFFNGTNWIYANTGTANQYQMNGGSFIWGAAASGTAGGTISWIERMRLDASGNLGLGTTPSPWDSSGNLQLAANASITAGGAVGFLSNTYVSGGQFRYIANNFASNYTQSSGRHIWNTAPSGTAGTAITFTQAMTLDASGNLGVGTTSPGVRVDSNGQVRALEAGTGSGNGGLIGSTTSADGNAGVLFQTNSASRWNLTTSGTSGANLRVYNYALGTTVATFDASGNLIQSAPTTPPSLATNGTMVFNLTSNTNLRVSVRGSDGVTRTANITLA